MPGALKRLFSTPVPDRRSSMYEAVFDDYVRWAGGSRVSELLPTRSSTENADYVFERDAWRLVVELKQVGKYEPGRNVDAYFSDLHRNGQLRSWENSGPGQIKITPTSLTIHQWRRFYDKSWPQVPAALAKANRQLRSTVNMLPATEKRQVTCVLLVNTADYNLPTDLLYRLVERKMKKEWKAGAFRSIDFVACQSLDLYHPQQHLLHARHIARTVDDPAIVGAARWTFERWVAYANDELGTQVTIDWSKAAAPLDLNVDLTFAGKLRLSREGD